MSYLWEVTHHAKYAWALFALIAGIVNFYTLREAVRDLWAVTRGPESETYQIRAWQAVRDDFTTFVFQIGLLIIRMWVLYWPDPKEPAFFSRWVLDATVVTLLQIMLAVNCVMDLRDRRRIVRLLMENGTN